MKKYLLLFIVAGLAITSCTKEAENSASISDVTLASLATSGDFQFQRTVNRNENARWKIQMNDVSSKVYAEGKSDYPANSMIVKEKYDASGVVSGYDIMYNAPGDPNSDGEWLYSSVDVHGGIIIGVNNKGTSCKNCHSGVSNKSLQ
jgi:hypothetical protein